LRSLVCAYSRNNRERLTLSRLLSRGLKSDVSDLPKLREPISNPVSIGGDDGSRGGQGVLF
jgi:hypothetical protein